MKTVTKIVSEFGQKGHPLGKSISREEVPSLVSQLRQRLGMQASELDFSPVSLKLLEDELFKMSKMNWIEVFSEEEIVQFVRELVAYIGEVLVLHADGKWEPLGTLFSTHVVFYGDIKIYKEGRRRIVPSIVLVMGSLVAGNLDLVSLGNKPLIYGEYQSAKKKTFKEQLNQRK